MHGKLFKFSKNLKIYGISTSLLVSSRNAKYWKKAGTKNLKSGI
jgi:hypothetical protein